VPQNAKPSSGKWGPTAWVLALTLVLFVASLPYKWFVVPVLAYKEYPYLAADSVIDGIRKHRDGKGRWPQRVDFLASEGAFKGLGEVVIASDGRSLEVASNIYVYYPIDNDRFSLWVFPKGKYAGKAYTHYLLVGATAMRHWAGDPFGVEEVKTAVRLPRPSESQLAEFKLKEVVEEEPGQKKGRGFGWKNIVARMFGGGAQGGNNK
jgi:hypothetical protein